MAQEPTLRIQAPAKTTERRIDADHPVTRHEERRGIAGTGLGGGSVGPGVSGPGRQLGITDRRTRSDFTQRLPGGGETGPADALIMARSGLERVRLAGRIAYEFSCAEMLPAVGQGIVAVECAIDDWQTRSILASIDDLETHRCADAEREVLWVLNGHCNSPIAGYSSIDGAQMSLTASVLDEAGLMFIEASGRGPADRPRELGRAVALELLAKGASDIIERSRPR